MAEDEKESEGVAYHGTEWEVVSLTASTYAAAPSPEGFRPPGGSQEEEPSRHEHISSDPMFMSGHFVFPPKEHENLPVEPNSNEIQNEPGDQDVLSILGKGEQCNEVHEDNSKFKIDEGLHGIEFFDKGEQFSVHSLKFGEGKSIEGLSFVGKEDIIYGSTGFSALHAEANVGISEACKEGSYPFDSDNPSHENVEDLLDSDALKLNKENASDGPGLPREVWWKRQAASWYNHAKEGNTFWSVFVAAALMGLVVLGRRWHRDNLQLQQLKWQFSMNSERVKWMAGPINRFKDILGGHQRSLLVHAEAIPNHQGLLNR